MGIFTDESGDPKGCAIPALIAGLVALVLGISGTCTAIGNKWKVSEGDRVGMVNKISEKGMFWNTYEGQVALEGVSSNGKSLGANVWDFSIDNYFPKEKQEGLIKQLQDSMNSGQKVKIHYQEMMHTWPWRSGTGYLIQSVIPLSVGTSSNENKEADVARPVDEPKKTEFGVEVDVDGKKYYLRHDNSGKLKVIELRDINN